MAAEQKPASLLQHPGVRAKPCMHTSGTRRTNYLGLVCCVACMYNQVLLSIADATTHPAHATMKIAVSSCMAIYSTIPQESSKYSTCEAHSVGVVSSRCCVLESLAYSKCMDGNLAAVQQ